MNPKYPRQPHEYHDPVYYCFMGKGRYEIPFSDWLEDFYQRLDAIKSKQVITKRYILDNQYWEKAK